MLITQFSVCHQAREDKKWAVYIREIPALQFARAHPHASGGSVLGAGLAWKHAEHREGQ